MIHYHDPERRNHMKHKLIRAASLLLLICLAAACGGKGGKASERVLEKSAVWTLGDRYPLTYSSLAYAASYEASGEMFTLSVRRNAKETGMSKSVKESRSVDGIVYALCESKNKDADGNAFFTYYECYTGSFRYVIGSENSLLHIETVLSMDDAIALIAAPESPQDSVKLLEAEWSAQYRTEACNLDILIRPNDKDALVKSLSSSYRQQTENGETYYVSSAGDEIVYSDGTSSVQIRQGNRSAENITNYLTLSECKAILTLLK